MRFLSEMEFFSGTLVILSDEEGITSVYYKGSRFNFMDPKESYILKDNPPIIDMKRWLSSYLEKRSDMPMPKFHFEASPFQREVYDIVLRIPFSQVSTYQNVAKEIAKNRGVERVSCQAVGTALSKNPIQILIPCHRIIKSDFTLGGYAGGEEKKKILLMHEGHIFDEKGIIKNRNSLFFDMD